MSDTQVTNETLISSVDGDEELYVVDDPAGTPLDRKVTTNQLRQGIMQPALLDIGGGTNGGYIGPPIGSTISAAAQSADVLGMMPFFVPADITVNELALDVTVAGAGLARLGIYNCRSHNNLLPGTLILDAGTISVNVTNTLQRLTGLSQVLKRGWYNAACVSNIGYTAFRVGSGALGWLPFGSGVTVLSGYSRAFAYAALPADESAQSHTNGTPTAIFVNGTFV